MRIPRTSNLANFPGWTRSLGIIIVALGMIAVIVPLFVASVAIELIFAWLFLINGIVQAVYAFMSDEKIFLLPLTLSLLSIITVIVLLIYPLTGMFTLTLILGVFIFLDGALQVIQAFQLRPLPKWGWVLVNGISNIILGIFIWSQWPFEAVWILGLFVGISLIFNGMTIITLSTPVRGGLSKPNYES